MPYCFPLLLNLSTVRTKSKPKQASFHRCTWDCRASCLTLGRNLGSSPGCEEDKTLQMGSWQAKRTGRVTEAEHKHNSLAIMIPETKA